MGHGAEPYKVPHPSIYKVENVPELMEVKEALARQGLKDPWLRNEAWRYEPKQFGTHAQRLRIFLFRGFFWGLGAAALTVAAETFIGGGNGHGHGKDEHH